MHPSDPLLAELLARGDHAALADLYDRYGAIAYGLARHVTRDDAQAVEVVRRAFATAWRDAAEPRAASPTLFAWLIAITHREAVGAARTARTLDPDADWPAVRATTGGGTVRTALALLPRRDREVIDRCYLDGYLVLELACRHDLPRTTIQTRARSAVRTLRSSLSATVVPPDRALERSGSHP